MSFTKALVTMVSLVVCSAPALASTGLEGVWVVDKSIPIYCDVHPAPYTAEEKETMTKALQGLPSRFTLTVDMPESQETFWDFDHTIVRALTLQLSDSHTKTYGVYIGVRRPSHVQIFRYYLRPSPMGRNHIELLNVDTEICGLNNAVATLKRTITASRLAD